MTIKQEETAKKLVALTIQNGRKPCMAEALRQAGYSPVTAEHPDKLTKSKAWPELLEKYLPDDKLLRTHDEALQATKWNDFTGEREPDHTTRLKAVDMGYKVKGKTSDTNVAIQVNFKEEAKKELEEYK
jgi:hypothetical protein